MGRARWMVSRLTAAPAHARGGLRGAVTWGKEGPG
ncbi:hypothetical protein SAMN05216267_100492 [Actinacidiphila rubida]|uniref:Uncharacterized protein n=1 Tax=Actinacidiphila rubida TaxID=310780 RepID=A0A1H8FW11_9ACTN|nr:hypothetical protein SAMN05216267_100492 [Actinacidiphila rubida]